MTSLNRDRVVINFRKIKDLSPKTFISNHLPSDVIAVMVVISIRRRGGKLAGLMLAAMFSPPYTCGRVVGGAATVHSKDSLPFVKINLLIIMVSEPHAWCVPARGCVVVTTMFDLLKVGSGEVTVETPAHVMVERAFLKVNSDIGHAHPTPFAPVIQQH